MKIMSSKFVVAVFASFFAMWVGSLWAGEHSRIEECSNASYRGDYGFTLTGTIASGAIAIVGRFTADGHGNISGTQTRSTSGTFVGIFHDTYTETYTVNTDCTGSSTKTLTSGGNAINFDFVILQGGRKIRSIELIEGVAVTLVADRDSQEDD